MEGAAPECAGQTLTLPLSLSFYRYYINLCQKIYKGPLDCSERASVCRKSPSGDVQVLGLVHTQKLDVIGKAWTLVAWSQVSCQIRECGGVFL